MLTRWILGLGNFNTNREDRVKISLFASGVGLFLNIFLFLVKFILFLFTDSVSIFADAINNLNDTFSSIITIFGMKFSARPSDKEHPYGHGRAEYVVGFIVALFVLLTGIEFVRASINRILNPTYIEYGYLSLFLMVVSIGLKFYMSIFYKIIGKKINSMPMAAQSKDSLSDVLITFVVICGIVISRVSGVILDGYIGLLVSLIIVYSGIKIIKGTLSEILGEAPRELIHEIKHKVLSYDDILGVHDVVIVNFGPKEMYITLDVEVDYKKSLLEAHSIIDRIERDIQGEYNCILSIHVDPVGMYSEMEKKAVGVLNNIVKYDRRIKSFHDLSYNDGIFYVDIVVNGNLVNDIVANMIREDVIVALKEVVNCRYEVSIDRYF